MGPTWLDLVVPANQITALLGVVAWIVAIFGLSLGMRAMSRPASRRQRRRLIGRQGAY